MKNKSKTSERRNFIKGSLILSAGLISAPILSHATKPNIKTNSEGLYIIGPKKGYSPEIGTLLSTLTMMRKWVVDTVKDLNVEQLDFQLDEKSNSIGAMLYHLAATEKYYQLHTFDNLKWGSWSDEIKQEWDLPMELGENGRKNIKGHDIDFYLTKLEEVRETTHKEFADRKDKWLEKTEMFFENKPTNNYCKWFHVCEHESNHRGQIKFIIKRIPS